MSASIHFNLSPLITLPPLSSASPNPPSFMPSPPVNLPPISAASRSSSLFPVLNSSDFIQPTSTQSANTLSLTTAPTAAAALTYNPIAAYPYLARFDTHPSIDQSVIAAHSLASLTTHSQSSAAAASALTAHALSENEDNDDNDDKEDDYDESDNNTDEEEALTKKVAFKDRPNLSQQQVAERRAKQNLSKKLSRKRKKEERQQATKILQETKELLEQLKEQQKKIFEKKTKKKKKKKTKPKKRKTSKESDDKMIESDSDTKTEALTLSTPTPTTVAPSTALDSSSASSGTALNASTATLTSESTNVALTSSTMTVINPLHFDILPPFLECTQKEQSKHWALYVFTSLSLAVKHHAIASVVKKCRAHIISLLIPKLYHHAHPLAEKQRSHQHLSNQHSRTFILSSTSAGKDFFHFIGTLDDTQANFVMNAAIQRASWGGDHEPLLCEKEVGGCAVIALAFVYLSPSLVCMCRGCSAVGKHGPSIEHPTTCTHQMVFKLNDTSALEINHDPKRKKKAGTTLHGFRCVSYHNDASLVREMDAWDWEDAPFVCATCNLARNQ